MADIQTCGDTSCRCPASPSASCTVSLILAGDAARRDGKRVRRPRTPGRRRHRRSPALLREPIKVLASRTATPKRNSERIWCGAARYCAEYPAPVRRRANASAGDLAEVLNSLRVTYLDALGDEIKGQSADSTLDATSAGNLATVAAKSRQARASRALALLTRGRNEASERLEHQRHHPRAAADGARFEHECALRKLPCLRRYCRLSSGE